MARTTADRVAAYERRYRELATQLADIGLIASGSVVRRYTRCGTAGCRCHADTRRLTEREANLYTEWIANDRQLRRLIGQMRQTAAQATELLLKQPRT